VNAEFNLWLLIVGVALGAALAWLVLADMNRRDEEISREETAAEAGWLARSLGDARLDADLAERVLQAHRRYLGFPPPDELVAPEEFSPAERPQPAPAAQATAATAATEAPVA
jgi:hypothetical protein